MMFTMLNWPPSASDTALFYAMAICWGMADGVWNTQINGFWVALLSDADSLEIAFGNYRLWECIGAALLFGV